MGSVALRCVELQSGAKRCDECRYEPQEAGMVKRIMRQFRMSEISAVDRPAQAHAKVVLMKRDFSASERRSDAKSGAAMPDGSFPILTAEDLANARRLVGHAKDPAAARAHIARRAKALGLSKLETEMTDEDIQKAVEAAVAEAKIEFDALKKRADDAEAALAKAEVDLVKATMTEAEREYYDKADDKEKDDFAGMSAEDRKKKMKKVIDDAIPEYVRKQLAEAEELKKRLASLEDDRAAASFAKRATELGLEGHGETLRKAYGGNADAIVKLESLLKGLTEQVKTGKVFAEFGSNQSNAAAPAADELNAQAAAYREGQIKIGKKCSPEQAWTAVYLGNADLKKRYDDEETKKRRAA
jgi:hypothetical protein